MSTQHYTPKEDTGPARNYLSHESDQAHIVFILRTARRLLGSMAFAPYVDEEVFPGPQVQTDEEIVDFARRNGGTSFHKVGTARMGPDGDRMAVVDPQCRVRGVQGLRVVDASIMPTITSGNTNAPTIMIAEKAADLVLAATR